MRLVIVHDSAGNIKGLAASPKDGPLAYPVAEPGLLMSVVDAPELSKLEGAKLHKRLTDIMVKQRVKADKAKASLTKE